MAIGGTAERQLAARAEYGRSEEIRDEKNVDEVSGAHARKA